MDTSTESPINFLLPYITGMFESTNPDFSHYVKRMIDEGKIDPEITLVNTGKFGSPKTAFGKIILNEPFMCSLWSFCYYYYVLHEEYVVPYYNEGKKAKSKILDDAEALRKWGYSLQMTYSSWPQNLPMPTLKDDNVLIVNQIFLYSMNFIMCHEFAHIDKAPQQGTPIEQEQEADEVSFSLLLKDCNETNNFVIYLGIIMGLASLLILNPNAKDSKSHPSSISRLDAFVRKIDLQETHTLWCIITIVLHDWNMRNDLGYQFPTESDTFKSIYIEMMEIINNSL